MDTIENLCTQCGFSAKGFKELIIHRENVHRRKKFHSNNMKSKRKQKDDLDIHGRKEKKLAPMYVCKICNKDFKSVKKFIEHSISSHSNNTKSGGSQDEKQHEKPDENQDENQDEKFGKTPISVAQNAEPKKKRAKKF